MTRLLDGAEARQRSALIDKPRYDVELDVTDDERFSVRVTIQFECRRPGATSFLDCALDVRSARLNGGLVGDATGGRLELAGLDATNEITIEATGRYDPAARGLGRMTDEDGAVHVFTLLEPCFAHRVFPCFDQPDLGGPVTLALVVPSQWTAASTGLPTTRTPVGAGAERWSFEPTPALPLYAFALAAGPFHELRRDNLGLLCRRSVADRLDADSLFELAHTAITTLADTTGVAYPFDKLDQVFVPGFSGALEGAGCLLLSEDFLLAGDVDAIRRDTRAATIIHEIAHMWFGNLVTIRWWDELWLKEALATYFGLVATEVVAGSRSAWHLLALRYEADARALDELSVSHPIAVSEDDLQRTVDGYDAITYFKGAAAVRQLDAQLGAGTLAAGLRAWLMTNAREAAGIETLRDELERASGGSLARFFEQWLGDSGVGDLSIDVVCGHDGAVASAQIKHAGVARMQRVRVGAYDLVGGSLEERDSPALLVGESADLPFLVGLPRAALLLPDPDGAGYANRRLDPESSEMLRGYIGTLADANARVAGWNALWDAVRHGELLPTQFARAARIQLATETEPAIAQLVLARAKEALTSYAEPAEAADDSGELAEYLYQRAFDDTAAPSVRAASLEAFIALTTDVDALDRLLADDRIAPGTRRASLMRQSALGATPSTVGLQPQEAAAVEAAAPAKQAKDQAWDRIVSPGRPIAWIQLIALGFHQPHQTDLLEPYAVRYADELGSICARLPWEIARAVATELFPRAATRRTLEAVNRLLAANRIPPGLERIVLERSERLTRILDARAVASVR